jgi:hypothetical protein
MRQIEKMHNLILKLFFFFLISGITESLAWQQETIEIINPKIVATKLAGVSRKKVGIKGDYKPSMAILPSGELLLTTFRSRNIKEGKIIEEVTLFRSIDNGESWSNGEIMKDLPGREPYITVLKDGTLLMTSHLLPQDIRNSADYVRNFINRSTDQGRTWKTYEINSRNTNTSRNTITMNDGSLLFLFSIAVDHYFHEEEFDSMLHAKKLCEEINKDIAIQLSGEYSCISTLNSLLEFPGLYEQIVLKRRELKFSMDVEDLLQISNSWRLQNNPAHFNEHERNIVVRLNRQLLEELYPSITPKVHDVSDLNYRILSYDNGKSWSNPEKINITGAIPKACKDPFFGEAFLFKTIDSTLYAIVRVDSGYFPIKNEMGLTSEKIDKYWNHYDRLILVKSKDGINWSLNKDFLSYGDMYPSIIHLYHNVIMLTYTVRDLKPSLGVKSIIGIERQGEIVFDSDFVMIDTKTPISQDSGGGFGNTVWYAGKFITCYSYKDYDGDIYTEVAIYRLPMNYANY